MNRPPATVLVVDDNPENCKLLEAYLVPQGYRVEAAADGEEALVKVREVRPNLILLDLMLPKLNGFEVCKRLKTDPETLSIPIIMITALDDSSTKIQGLDLGADDFLTKPFDKPELLARVKSLLRINTLVREVQDAKAQIEQWSRSLEQKVEEKTLALRESQAQLIQAEKMSALGELISGVAHELNNPLTGIMGYSQLLQAAECSEDIKSDLRRIHEDALRCQKIIQNLLGFARRHRPEKKWVGVNGIIENTLELLSYEFRTNQVKLDRAMDPELPKTMADFHQLQQVFVNIINNAVQAIVGEKRKGTIRVTTETDAERRFIRATVQDDGPGIPADILSRIFDPFFTTKDVGQGTGLGLSLSYGIIQEHGGSISVHSTYGQGAVFRVELPIVDEPAEGEEPPGAIAPALPSGRNILVVDDEAEIVDLLHRILSADGHRVDTALSGRRARDKIGREDYDLILLDMKMPEVGGDDVYEYILENKPHLAPRVIFCTGDTINENTRAFFDKASRAVLEKPFSVEALHRVLAHTVQSQRRPELQSKRGST